MTAMGRTLSSVERCVPSCASSSRNGQVFCSTYLRCLNELNGKAKQRYSAWDTVHAVHGIYSDILNTWQNAVAEITTRLN